MREEAKTRMASGAEAEASCWSAVWDWGLAGDLLLLLMYYRTYTTHLFLAQIFKVDETTICRAIKRIAPLAERILKIKPERLLSENDLQLLIVDATEQRIERPKNQRDYYSGKAHACTIKTEVVIDPKWANFTRI